MKSASLAASILGCAWLLVNALSSPEDLSRSTETDSLAVKSQYQTASSPVSDSTALHQKDSTAAFRVSIVPID